MKNKKHDEENIKKKVMSYLGATPISIHKFISIVSTQIKKPENEIMSAITSLEIDEKIYKDEADLIQLKINNKT